MPDKAQNNWKQILENADGLTGVTVKDKNAVWEKLHARLHKKKVNKFSSWYWVAAACLVIVTTIATIFLRYEKQHPFITVSPVYRQPLKDTKKSLAKEQKRTSPISSETLVKNKIPISYNRKNIPVKKDESINKNDLFADSTSKAIVTETGIKPTLQIDSADRRITNAAPAKKKLIVVHINDLGQPMEESTADNKFSEKHGFQLKILNNEYYNPSPGSSGNNRLILFKSRNASN